MCLGKMYVLFVAELRRWGSCLGRRTSMVYHLQFKVATRSAGYSLLNGTKGVDDEQLTINNCVYII